jgi:hypothetical protein
VRNSRGHSVAQLRNSRVAVAGRLPKTT